MTTNQKIALVIIAALLLFGRRAEAQASTGRTAPTGGLLPPGGLGTAGFPPVAPFVPSAERAAFDVRISPIERVPVPAGPMPVTVPRTVVAFTPVPATTDPFMRGVEAGIAGASVHQLTNISDPRVF